MRLHHMGIAPEDLEKSIRYHKVLFNLQPITKIEKDPLQKVSVALLVDSKMTGISIELVAPLSEVSMISNLLRMGIYLCYICYVMDGVESTLMDAGKRGSIIISGPSLAKLYNEKRIAFIYTSEEYAVEFLEEKPQSL